MSRPLMKSSHSIGKRKLPCYFFLERVVLKIKTDKDIATPTL
jgi:hypothetical protein